MGLSGEFLGGHVDHSPFHPFCIGGSQMVIGFLSVFFLGFVLGNAFQIWRNNEPIRPDVCDVVDVSTGTLCDASQTTR